MRKVMNIDAAALRALELLAADRGVSLQELIDEALADLLRKHRRPVTTKEMFAASLKDRPRRQKGRND